MAATPDLPIETERLTLRPFRNADIEVLIDIYSRPEVVRFLYTPPWRPAEARVQAERKIVGRRLAREGDALSLAVVPRGEERPLGEVLLIWRSAAHRQGEIGYVMHPDGEGRGYATEAARALLGFGFGPLDLHRIYARCDARNLASIRVMERLGMRREAHFRQDEFVKGEWCDTLHYALLAAEWRRSPRDPV